MNSMKMLQNFLARGFSPQKIVEQMANNNPMVANLIQMANSGNKDGIENFARNMFKEKGRDFDKEFSEFKSKFNTKQ